MQRLLVVTVLDPNGAVLGTSRLTDLVPRHRCCELGYTWYDLRNDGYDPKYGEHHFGLVRNAYRPELSPVCQPKPAHAAAKTLIHTLRGYRFSERWAVGNEDDYVLAFQRGPGDTAGYQFPRMVHYLGKWIRHGEWYPDIKLRLFRKDLGHSEGQEPHDRVVVDGPVKTLRAPLYHFTYDNLADHIHTINRFSSITANEKFHRGDVFRWRDLFFRPPFRFFKSYILKSGLLDGRQGFIIAVLSAFGVFVKYAKLLELGIQHRPPDPRPHD